MFCSKCGVELGSNTSYCPNCGTKVGGGGSQINVNLSAEEIKRKANALKGSVIDGTNGLGKNAILTFSAAALLIIGLILALSPLFKVSSLFGAYESFSPFDLEELTFLKALTIIFYIISVAAILLPIVLNKACKPLYFLPPLFTSLWSVALILVLYIVATGEMDGTESFVSFGLSSSAWFLIIVSLITIAIAVKLMRDLKAAMKNSSSNVLT